MLLAVISVCRIKVVFKFKKNKENKTQRGSSPSRASWKQE